MDDHRTFSELLTLGLGTHSGLLCVGTADNIRDALQLVAREKPDVVVMDVRLGEESGVEATATITERWPDVAVVVLTAYPTPHLMTDVIRAGASAMLPKDGALEELLEAMLTSRPRLFTVPPGLMQSMMERVNGDGLASPLTPREHEVLALLASGRDVRSISKMLGISLNTCRSYVKALLAKLGAHSQLEAVVVAHERGLLGPKSHA
ncbi:MAG: response regulator transcription factor [Nocardioides sp.]